MLTETRGTIVMNAILDGHIAYQGEIPQRTTGAIVSDRPGVTTPYALEGIQERDVFVPRGHRGLRGHDHRRALPRQRHQRQLRPREAPHQHARQHRRRSHPPRPLPAASPSSSPSSSSPRTSSSRSRPSPSACASSAVQANRRPAKTSPPTPPPSGFILRSKWWRMHYKR